jgi:hypothetical protein
MTARSCQPCRPCSKLQTWPMHTCRHHNCDTATAAAFPSRSNSQCCPVIPAHLQLPALQQAVDMAIHSNTTDTETAAAAAFPWLLPCHTCTLTPAAPAPAPPVPLQQAADTAIHTYMTDTPTAAAATFTCTPMPAAPGPAPPAQLHPLPAAPTLARGPAATAAAPVPGQQRPKQ